MKKKLSNILLSLFSICILLLLLEGVVRLLVPEKFYQFSPGTQDWTGDDLIGWRNKPNYEDVSMRIGRVVKFKTNMDGFRPANAVREKKNGVVRVMLVGNSTVTARDIPEQETIHYYLDSLLDLSGQEYEVINAGVLGYATDQSLLHIQQQIGNYHPDVVCYGYCINDLYANNSGFYSGVYKADFELLNGQLQLVPLEKANTDILNATRSNSIRDLIQHSALYGLLRPAIQQIRIKMSKQAELDQGGMNDLDRYNHPVEDEPLFLKLAALVKEMDKTCQQDSALFIFYPHPEVMTVWPAYRKKIGKEDVSPYIFEKKLAEVASKDSVHFVGMVEHFLDNQQRGPFHLLPNDPHCNASGYMLQAEVLAKYILEKRTASDETNHN